MSPLRRLLAILVALAAVVALVLIALRRTTPTRAPTSTSSASPTSTSSAAPVPSRLPITLPPPPAAKLPDDALPASFEGRVVSRTTGRPVGGADLTFSRAGAAASVRAGPDGAFRFDPPQEGRWLLAAVTAPGFLPFAPEWGHSPVQLDARAGRHVRGLEIHLLPAAQILGRVVDAEGRPIAGAQARLLGVSGEAALVSIPDRFTSDASGEFRFSAPQGTVIEARKAGFAPARAELDLLATVNWRVTLTLRPAAGAEEGAQAIAGRVVARDGGAPIPGALVVAAPERAFGVGAAAAAQAVSVADGSFELSGLDPGHYRVEARAEARATGGVRRVAAGSRDVVIELGLGGRLRGCVADAATGAPVAPFTVLVFVRRSSLFRTLQRSVSVVDGSGCYALDDLLAGPAAVVVSAPGYAPSAEVRVDLSESREAVADVRLERGGRLSGVVLSAATRTPLQGARLAVEGSLSDAASTFPVLAEATTDADGRFVLEGLPRRFSVVAVAAGYHARVLAGIDVPPSGEAGPIEIPLHAVGPGEEPRTELVGINIGVAPRGDAVAIIGVRAGGGAAEVGLVAGDLILRVDGTPVEDLGFGGAVDAIRGPEGTWVTLTIQRGDATFDVRVPRRLVRG